MDGETQGTNRLFIILAISLIGLLVLGLLGIGGVFIIRQNMEQQAEAAKPTATTLIRLPNPSSTPTTMLSASETPAPTPTNTPVVTTPGSGAVASGVERGSSRSDDKKQVTAAASTPKPTPTRTPVRRGQQAAGVNVVPETGFGGVEAILSAVGLIAVFFIARRMRTTL